MCGCVHVGGRGGGGRGVLGRWREARLMEAAIFSAAALYKREADVVGPGEEEGVTGGE